MQLTLPAVTFGSYAGIDVAWQRSVAFQVNAGGDAEVLALLSGCTGEFNFPKSAYVEPFPWASDGTYAIYSLNASNVLNKYNWVGDVWKWKIDSAFTPVYSCSDIYNGMDSGVVVLKNGSLLFPEKNPSNLYFSGVKSVSIAEGRILVLKTDGTAGWCKSSEFNSTPGQPDPPLTAISFDGSVVSASIGYYRSRGFNYYGVKADNTVLSVLSMGFGATFSGKATQVAAEWLTDGNLFLGEDGTLTNDGAVWAGAGYNPCGVAEIATGQGHSIALMADGSVRTWGYLAPTIPSGYNHSFISIRGGCFTRSDGSQFLYSSKGRWEGSAELGSLPEDLRVPLFARNTRPTRVYDGSLVNLGEAAQITFGPAQPSDFYLNAGANGSTTITSVANVGSYTLGALDGGYSIDDVILTITPGVPIIDSNQSAVGTLGVAFSKTFSLLGGTNRPVTSWVATGLPVGLAINATTGAITGTPSALGDSIITLSATGDGGTDTETATISITGRPVNLEPIFEIVCNITADVYSKVAFNLEPIFEIVCNITADVYAKVAFEINILEDSIIDFEIRGIDSISVNLQGVCEMDANGSWELYRDFGAFFGGVASFRAKFIARDVFQFAWGEFDLAKDFRGEIFLNCYTTIRGRVTPTPFAEVGLKLLDNRFDAELYRDVDGVESRPFDLTPASAQGVRDGGVPVLQSKERVVYNVWAAQMPPPGVQVHLSVYLKRSSSACASMLEEVADLNWQAGNARTVKYAEWDLCAAVPVRCQASAAGWQPGQNAVPYPFMFLQTNQVASGCLPASRLERGEGIDSQDLIFERGGIPIVNNTVSESHCVTPWLPDPATVCYGVVFTQSSCDCCVKEEGCKTTLRSAVGSKPLVWSEWVPNAAAYCPSNSVKQTRYELNGCAKDQAQTVLGTMAVGAWELWGPLASSVCLGVPFQQVRVDASGCSAPQTQSATGTMSPVWSEWSPEASSVCSGETFQQTRQNGCAIPQSRSATGTRSCSCSNSVSDESIYCRGSKFTCCGNGYAHTNRGCVYIGPAGYCGDAANQK